MTTIILTIGQIVLYIFAAALAIYNFANAAYYFNEKKHGWFGFYAVMAIYWMAWIIHHSFG